MSIPSEIVVLLEQLSRELNIIEQEATLRLTQVSNHLENFPDHPILIQLFATLNNYLLFVEITKRRIAYDRIILESQTVTSEQIQNAGEDLSELLGRVIDSKIAVERVKNRLENWS